MVVSRRRVWDFFEIADVLDEIEDMSNKLIKKWFRDDARDQCDRFLYVRGRKAPRFPVPAIPYNVQIEPTYVCVEAYNYNDCSIWEIDHPEECRCEICRFWS